MEKKQTPPQTNKDDLVHGFSTAAGPFFTNKVIIILIAMVMLGMFTGFLLPKGSGSGSKDAPKTGAATADVAKGTVIGSDDTKTFNDSTEGVLTEGGIEGEGQFHLVRPGGDSQNVYMTSSIVDLSKLVGKKIKVWGQTQKAQKAGWLMDVGRVEVLE